MESHFLEESLRPGGGGGGGEGPKVYPLKGVLAPAERFGLFLPKEVSDYREEAQSLVN